MIGLEGRKKKDTEIKSNTTIKILKTPLELYTVNITGQLDNCFLAKRIMMLAIRHYYASLDTAHSQKSFPDETSIAARDIQTFCAEMENLKAE